MLFLLCGFCGLFGMLFYMLMQQERAKRQLQSDYAKLFLVVNTLETHVANMEHGQAPEVKTQNSSLLYETRKLLQLDFTQKEAKPKTTDLELDFELPKL